MKNLGTMHGLSGMTMLTVQMGTHRLAISTDNIREILDPLPQTRVPAAPQFAPSVVNVRGSVIPVAHLHLPLRLQRLPATERNRFVVVDMVVGGEAMPVALFADAVLNVAFVSASEIGPLTKTSHNWPADLIDGIYRDKEGFVLIPDLKKIFESSAVRSTGTDA